MKLSKMSNFSQSKAEPSRLEKIASAAASSNPKRSSSGIVIKTPRRTAFPCLAFSGLCSLLSCESWKPSRINRGVPITPEGISLKSSPIHSRRRNCIHCPFSRLTVTSSIPSPLNSTSAVVVALALRKPVSSALRLVRIIRVMLALGSFFPSSRAIKTTAARYRLTATAQCQPHIFSKNSRSSTTAAAKATNRIRNGRFSFTPVPSDCSTFSGGRASSSSNCLFSEFMFSITSFLGPTMPLVGRCVSGNTRL